MTLPSRARIDAPLIDALAERAAYALLLALPLLLLHARAGAEIAIATIGALFLLHSWAARDTAWLRAPFTIASAAWCLWQIIASALGTGGLGLALAAVRLPLLAIALGHWLLQPPARRRTLWRLLAAAAAWIMLECWQQYLTGTNLFGATRSDDGALTGPFTHPRAGPELILLFFPVMVPATAALLARPGLAWRAAGAAAAAGAACTLLLIGQRMPSALLCLGLALTATLLPRLRAALAGVAVAALLLVAATPVIAPATYAKLVLKTDAQLTHFTASPYGQIWERALVIAEQHPMRGLGVNAFRRACADPAVMRGQAWLGVTDQQARQADSACNLHPHNYYLEAADNGGMPLLLLFTAMLATAAWRLRPGADPRRVGLFVGIVLAAWPLASTSAFMALPNAGWIFLVLGLGFGCAAPGSSGETQSLGDKDRAVHQARPGLRGFPV